MAFDRFSSKSRQETMGTSHASPLRSRTPLRWRRFAGPAVIMLAAAIATGPQFYRGNSCGHDFDFHLVSWFDCLSAWRHGILYPHWAPSPNYGAGEPRFIFYPPFTWMLGAALGLLLPWKLVPIALTFLFLAGTGLATRALARQFLTNAPATLAGCAAIYSGYALFTAYERSAFGELAGGFWIPLLLLYLLRDPNSSGSLLRRVFNDSAACLALVLAGAWLSNVPLGIMASYLLAAVALAVAIFNRSWVPILRATIAAALGFGLCAFYLVPAALEQHWVDIRQATGDPGEMIENSFLFGHHSEPLLHVHNLELTRVSLIAVSMVAVALAGLLIAWRRKTLLADHRRWIPLALIPIAVLLLQLPFSLAIWNLLLKLRLLQFPWRWLVVLEAPMAIFFVAGVWPRVSARRWVRIAIPAVCAALFLTATATAAINFFQPCDDEDAVAPMVEVNHSGTGFQGTDEYAPVDADNSMVATGLPDACLVTDPDTTLGALDTPGANPDWWVEQRSCDAIYSAIPQPAQDHPEHLHFVAVLPHAGYLILRLRTYPAWRIMLNGHPAGPFIQRDDGLIDLPVPQGPVDLTVDWTTTPDIVAGRWLTALALLLLIALGLLEHRTNSLRHPGL
jgi:6-pyruvoyl-tetrahydropterin synthase related domain